MERAKAPPLSARVLRCYVRTPDIPDTIEIGSQDCAAGARAIRRKRLAARGCFTHAGNQPGQKALIAIETLALLRGSLSPRVLGMVTEWAALHRAELMEDWNLAKAETQLRPIAPLE